MNSTIKTFLFILINILLCPLIIFEYILLFWFWAGNGTFLLISIPCFYISYCLAQFLLYVKKRRWAHPPSIQHQLKNKPPCPTDFGAISYKVKNRNKKIFKILLLYTIIILTPILAVISSFALAAICDISVFIY